MYFKNVLLPVFLILNFKVYSQNRIVYLLDKLTGQAIKKTTVYVDSLENQTDEWGRIELTKPPNKQVSVIFTDEYEAYYFNWADEIKDSIFLKPLAISLSPVYLDTKHKIKLKTKQTAHVITRYYYSKEAIPVICMNFKEDYKGFVLSQVNLFAKKIELITKFEISIYRKRKNENAYFLLKKQQKTINYYDNKVLSIIFPANYSPEEGEKIVIVLYPVWSISKDMDSKSSKSLEKVRWGFKWNKHSPEEVDIYFNFLLPKALEYIEQPEKLSNTKYKCTVFFKKKTSIFSIPKMEIILTEK